MYSGTLQNMSTASAETPSPEDLIEMKAVCKAMTAFRGSNITGGFCDELSAAQISAPMGIMSGIGPFIGFGKLMWKLYKYLKAAASSPPLESRPLLILSEPLKQLSRSVTK